jgi:hypothetical protein
MDWGGRQWRRICLWEDEKGQENTTDSPQKARTIVAPRGASEGYSGLSECQLVGDARG